jgi:menaquinone-dependent protoporphyrinogen IX oxidase
MNCLICYGTKYGSTEQVCEYIREGMAADAIISHVSEIDSLDYDLIVIGSPIFIGKPIGEVVDFIAKHYEELKNKTVAVFVTCWAASTKYSDAGNEFLSQVIKYLPKCNIICTASLPGKLLMDKIEESDRKLLGRLLRRISNQSDEFDANKIEWKDARSQSKSKDFGSKLMKQWKLIQCSKT